MARVDDINEFETEWRNGFYSKKVLIEGDSWVSHPFTTNLSIQVDSIGKDDYLILNIANPGDEAHYVFGKQMNRLRRLLNEKQRGDKFDLILLSAAGNDIVGPEIVEKGFVKNKRDFPNLFGRELLTNNFYNETARIADGYIKFLKMRDKSKLNPKTPVMTHVYSYLQPREVGTHLGPIEFNKGWIKLHLKRQGIKDEEEHYDILVGMLDSLYRKVSRLETDYKNFKVADTRTLLLKKDGSPNLDLWYDEIHPNRRGFRKVANHIMKAATDAGML